MICKICNDSHLMLLNEIQVMCTFCPIPCQKCRKDGIGAYCQNIKCNCDCHIKKTKLDSCFINKNKLIEILNAMEKYPQLYGSCDCVEGIYWVLINLLEPEKKDKILELFAKECKKISGDISNMSISNFTSDYNILTASLRNIRNSL